MQGESELDNLLSQLKAAQSRLSDQHSRYVPLALKIAPDMDDNQVKNIADALIRHKIDGVIATNTTITRDAVKDLPYAQEAGGLSGAPVRDVSTHVIRLLKQELATPCRLSVSAAFFPGKMQRKKWKRVHHSFRY